MVVNFFGKKVRPRQNLGYAYAINARVSIEKENLSALEALPTRAGGDTIPFTGDTLQMFKVKGQGHSVK